MPNPISRRSFLLALGGVFLAAPSAFALKIKGTEYMPISQLASLCGMRYKTTVSGKEQTVYSKHSRMDFTVHSRAIQLNGTTVWLGHPVAAEKGMLYVANRDYNKTIVPILFPQKNGVPPKLFNIFIDAGHGGKDNGTQNDRLKLKEKNIALDIAMRVGTELKKNGYKVSYSRTKDNFVDLEDRPKMANRAKADLFLSIHCNATGTKTVKGVETFALTPTGMPSTSQSKASRSDSISLDGNDNDSWNKLLGYYIQKNLVSATKSPDRGLKKARFAVLRTAKMPAILVETGFLSNDQEARLLATPAYRQKVAKAIADAVITYHKTLRRLTKSRSAATGENPDSMPKVA